MFHEGELAVQDRAGVRTMAARVGKGIRPAIPPAAREFLAEQTLAVAGWAEPAGGVWASLLAVPAGAIGAPDPRTIAVAGLPAAGDPLRKHLAPGLALGMLVIDLATRRRMRANGVVTRHSDDEFALEIHEAYSNCPKYIQARQTEAAADGRPAAAASGPRRLEWLDAAASALIKAADTCFIASTRPGGDADASHRGGKPGFVQVADAKTLLLPDYSGNMMFNTLGNLVVNPQAGLLFVDWDSGATLQLSGEAEILWDDSRMGGFAGAERLVRFRLREARLGCSALRGRLLSRSPFNP